MVCDWLLALTYGMFGFAGQAGAGPSGMQSQQAADTHAKAEGAKAAKGKRVAPEEDADEDESQVPELSDVCLTYQLIFVSLSFSSSTKWPVDLSDSHSTPYLLYPLLWVHVA